MAFFNWFRRNGGALDNSESGPQVVGPISIGTDAGIAVDNEKALGISGVWACCQIITNSVASLPLHWYRKTGDVREELEFDHPLSRLFYLQPNRFMKPGDLRKALTFQMALFNSGFAKIDRNPDGTPQAITPLSPVRMQVARDATGLTYHYQTKDGIVVFAAESILHLKGITSDGINGLARVDYARNALGLSASADMYASKQFANGGRPGGVIRLDQWLKDDQKEAIRKLYEGISSTALNANKLWVLEGGMQYQELGSNPNDMQMLDTRRYQLTEVARYFGVPEVLIGGGANAAAWPASFEKHVLAFLTFTLQGYMDEWEQELHYKLVAPSEKRALCADHEVEGFIRMDSQAKALYLSSLVQNGLMTRNEGRGILKRPPIEGGDELTVQVNLTGIQDLPQVGNHDAPEI